jgi:hypothetical protein
MRFTWNTPLFALSTTLTLLVLPATSLAQTAEAPPAPSAPPTVEGRPAELVPAGPGSTQIAPTNGGSNLLYEPLRIKRTVTLDPAAPLDGTWDRLYATQDSTGTRTIYFDWDRQALYLAAEIPSAAAVRFDLDCTDDGWLHGADNLTIQVTPPAEGASDPSAVAYRFDTVQNRDQPVWAASPIPAADIRVKAGSTPRGTYVVLVALPETERMGLSREPGKRFGLRVTSGALPDPSAETQNLSLRPMLRLTLTDAVEARGANFLSVKVSRSTTENVPGDDLKTTLEVRNGSASTVRVGRMFLRGSGGSGPLFDAATFASVDILPGKSIKRELKTAVSPASPFGALVLEGGYEAESGGNVTALAAVERVEPFVVTMDVDRRPVSGGAATPQGDFRNAKVVVVSRVPSKETAQLSLKLPDGWRLESGDLKRTLPLQYRGDARGTVYKVLVPLGAGLGTYPIECSVEVGGRSYKASGVIAVVK